MSNINQKSLKELQTLDQLGYFKVIGANTYFIGNTSRGM